MMTLSSLQTDQWHYLMKDSTNLTNITYFAVVFGTAVFLAFGPDKLSYYSNGLFQKGLQRSPAMAMTPPGTHFSHEVFKRNEHNNYNVGLCSG